MENSKIITGSMFCGKTEELQRLIKRYKIANKKVQIFKPSLDNRYSTISILTHDGAKILKSVEEILKNLSIDTKEYSKIKDIVLNNLGIEAISVNMSNDILDSLDSDVDVVGIDEVQFFDDNIINIIQELNRRNIKVIISALDLYASGEPFEITAKLCCLCKYVEKLHAVCIDCGNEEAYISHKIDSGDANHSSKIDIGSEGKYIAICENCREKREKENK